jgi:hypothetical protein
VGSYYPLEPIDGLLFRIGPPTRNSAGVFDHRFYGRDHFMLSPAALAILPLVPAFLIAGSTFRRDSPVDSDLVQADRAVWAISAGIFLR